jgi:hypothetical protein
MYRHLTYNNLLLLVLNIIGFACNTQKGATTALPLVHSNAEYITYRVDGELHTNWHVVPELKPDYLKIACRAPKSDVVFITDRDSIHFTLSPGETVQFYVLLHNKDSALTEVIGIPKNVNFSDDYIRTHQGKSSVEIPEVHELANIMVALSTIGRLDSNMVDMTTGYHKKVLDYFLPFQHHPAIELINQNITGVLDNKSYLYYYALKMNACGYMFDKENQIVNEGIVYKMGFPNSDDPFVIHKDLFADFARQANFRQFYSRHAPYYDSLIYAYTQLNPLDKMQHWLEDKFARRYGNYRITFSPLVNGAHSTNSFKDNGFEQTVMFVCAAQQYSKYSTAINEMINSRVVFTEIDHNFVNPVSDRYLAEINRAMADKGKWADKDLAQGFYASPYAIFNEYMTWAVFSLYCYDQFPEAEIEQYMPKMEKQMIKSRGFIKFKDFNQELISLYRNNPEVGVDAMYNHMLTWCENQ